MADPTRPTGNTLLDALADGPNDLLLSKASEMPLEAGSVYCAPGDVIDRAYFPRTGIISITTQVDDDAVVEAAAVGREGFVVAQSILGATQVGPQTYRGQVAGEMIVIDLGVFLDCAREAGRLRDLVQGYLQALFAQTAIGAACNARHQIDQRCARWILECHDRVEGGSFALRPEFLAMMLGAKRGAVNESSERLSRAGFMTYRDERISIDDREGLEGAACACYRRMKAEYARLVPLT